MTELDKKSFHHGDRVKTFQSRTSYLSFVFGVMAFILFLMIVISFIKKANSGNPITFQSFLNWLGDLNTFQINIHVSDFTIVADWGLFNGLRDFFNIFTTIAGVLVWFGSNLINAIIYISQFISFIFA